MSELAHTLSLVQEKLKSLQKKRIEHVQKIATKRSLLEQSYNVLQQDLKMTLYQDKKTLHSISNDGHVSSHLVPIISSASISTDQSLPVVINNDLSTKKQQQQQLFELVECQAWIRSGHVTIRAYGVPLLDCHDISQAHLWIPHSRDFAPEDIRLNTCYNLLPNSKHVFYMSFPLLLEEEDDEKEEKKTHSIACVYKIKNEYFTSEPIPIRYINNAQDTSWLSLKVLQVYFTCHVRIKQAFKLDKPLKKLELHPVVNNNKEEGNDDLYLSKDQSIVIHKVSDEVFDVYGFKAGKVASLASKYDFCIMSQDNTLKNLILSLGNESLTFGSIDYPIARAKMNCYMAAQ